MSNRKGIDTVVGVLAVIGILILVNVLGAKLFWRGDMTRGGEFTLSQGTVQTLEGLTDPVTVRAYFSEGLPGPLAAISRHVKDMLDEYYASASGNFRYEFIDPTSEETEEDKQKKKESKRTITGQIVREKTSVERELERIGIRSFGIRVNEADSIERKMVYMGVEVRAGDKVEVIPVVRSAEEFEYELTTLVRKVSRKDIPKIGFVVGHGGPEPEKDLSLLWQKLERIYELTTIDLGKKPEIDADVRAILVVGPKTALSEDEQKAIDRFVKGGGSAAFLVGPVAPDPQSLQSSPAEHGLEAMLASYGLKLGEGLLLDVEYVPIPVTRQSGRMRVTQTVDYPFFLLPKGLDRGHPITRGLEKVVFPFMVPVEMEMQTVSGVEARAIVHTTDKAMIQKPPFDLNPFQHWTRDSFTEAGEKDLIVALTGEIPSHFDKEAHAARARVLVAGGYSFVTDAFSGRQIGNQIFALNMVDWLVMDEALLAMRARSIDKAPLDELSDTSRNLAKYLNILGLPLAFVAFGLVRWRMREARRKRVRI
ncbi:MAG: GldG family protein [Deltaproteobacteria bacterium]|nr:GldG family protein [Deltaproteobacteria bacterium]